MKFPSIDYMPSISQLIYDASPGDKIESVSKFVVDRRYAGFVFNGVFVRNEINDTEFDLYHKYMTLFCKV